MTDVELKSDEDKEIDDILKFIVMSAEFGDSKGTEISKKRLLKLINRIVLRLWGG